MRYNLSNKFDLQAAHMRIDALAKRGAWVEVNERRARRSLSQNAYLHLLLGYFAAQTGCKLEFVKTYYYKIAANRSLFVRGVNAPIIGDVTTLRSSACLSRQEMSESIDRFKIWAASEAGILLPDADNCEGIAQMEREVESCKNYL